MKEKEIKLSIISADGTQQRVVYGKVLSRNGSATKGRGRLTGCEHFKNGDYNPEVNYKEVLIHYNWLVENGKQDEVKELLRKHGGILSIYCNMSKQNKY